MELFHLPATTIVGRVVPKNSFESYCTSRQRKMFAEAVSKITWENKLSSDTINLPFIGIKEIQLFRIELKIKDEILELLDIIDRSIPYHLILAVQYEGDMFFSAASKHAHPVNENLSVLDWRFKSDWDDVSDNKFELKLRYNIDSVFKDFCIQLANRPDLAGLSLNAIVELQRKVSSLSKEITHLENQLFKEVQYNRRVELNIELQARRKELESLTRLI